MSSGPSAFHLNQGPRSGVRATRQTGAWIPRSQALDQAAPSTAGVGDRMVKSTSHAFPIR